MWNITTKQKNTIKIIEIMESEIQHLPTLILYPDDIKYSGELSYDAVYEFVLKHSAKNKKIWKDYQFINHIEKTANKRCLVSFCKDDCISTKHLKLLSFKLHNILTFGTVDCHQIPEKCDVAAYSTNDVVYYENCFQSDAHNFGNIASIHSIYMSIITHLPDIKIFFNQDVEQIFDSNPNEIDHVIYLYDDEYKIDDNFKVFAENI
ncbi:hypothetical protein A3Q56_03193 [Intoshia linei]|uniref:Uncharacterized protein n=1 Tax=Intoshia linei TaxID=1819745 RepID=A0A177B4C0_9BILA|nr:hypothetical protein A3Q56_03193 [Intoshia linei]